jgi:hypothetical protein
MTTEDLKLLRDVQARDDEEVALQKKSARYRNSDKKLFESVVARVEHVISELLQNADDAEATKVCIDYADGVLTFQHDGKDFADDQFRSICSFAVSSKHTFKTTGFRGIGFKSTFSLGDSVHLITPRFQVKFELPRFTYPVELTDENADADFRITIRVPVRERSRRELESSLKVWRTAPCSLLFFHNLKGGVTIGSDHFVVPRAEAGNSLHTITRNGQKIWEGHVISVAEIKLPPEACEEIATLRGAARESEEDSATQLDILLGKNEAGRIYSILPTSGERRLQAPFALNGAFVLTPERDGIKSPSQSPTNRFLFAEAGRIVADHLIKELKVASDFSAELLRSYALLPLTGSLDKPDAETEASTELRAACIERLTERHWVLTADFKVACPGTVKLVQLPAAFSEVWPPETLRSIFAPDAYIVHPQMPQAVMKWLQDCGHLAQPANDDLLRALTKPKIPKPERQEQLFKLWTWAARTIILHIYQTETQVREWGTLNILPADGEVFLKSLDDVFNFPKETSDIFIRSGVKLCGLELYRLDTDFITADGLKLKNPPQAWWAMMDCAVVAITKERSLENMLTSVAKRIAKRQDGGLPSKDVLRALWRIHQEAGIALDKNLPVLRENGEALSVSKLQLILRTTSLDIELYVPSAAIAQLSLALELYPEEEQERERFCGWLINGGSALFFPQPVQSHANLGYSFQAQDYARRLGGNLIDARNGTYASVNYDWLKSLTAFWEEKSTESPEFFEKLVKLAIKHHGDFLRRNHLVIFRRCYSDHWSTVESRPQVPSSWVRYFRDKPCLRSQSGELRRPVDLFILTPSTSSLISAGESAVSAELQEAFGEELLTIIGCRNSLPGLAELTRLISAELDSDATGFSRIRWLLHAANEVFRSSTDDNEKEMLLSLLADRPSIPSVAGKLEKPDDLVQDAGDDTEVRVVAENLRGTAIIAALGIRQSPSRESDIAWLDNEIESGISLPREKLRKLRKLLAQPSSVSEHLWAQRKWLALDGAVRALDDLAYWHADLQELPVENITALALPQRTADFGVIVPLPQELQSFSKPNLLSCLQSELHVGDDGRDIDCQWLSAAAQVLWTEAGDAGGNQSTLESVALRWRSTRVVLAPRLSRRFTLDGAVIATGIEVTATWTAEDCFVIRATDEDDIFELTEEIARRLREPMAAIRTKTGSKLSAWIARSKGSVTKLGIKTLGIERLRPWPSADAADTATEEKESPKSETKGDSTAARPPRKPSDESGANESEQPNGEEDGSENHDTEAHQRVGPGRHQTGGDAHHGARDQSDAGDGDEGGDGQAAPRLRGHRSYAEGVGERKSRATSNPTRAREGGTPAAQSPERMRSYVEHSVDRRERERQRSEARAAGDAAEDIVVGWEQKAGREAKRLGGNNPGYDIVSKATDGAETRYIEVKSIAGAWGGAGVRLTPTQFVHAEELGDEYWLYVVEDAKTERPIVHAIQNPAAHISAFCFDCGWREIAEAETAKNPPSTFAPKVGDTVLFDNHEVVVEKLETRGAFLLVTFKLNGRTYRKMNTVLTPKE